MCETTQATLDDVEDDQDDKNDDPHAGGSNAHAGAVAAQLALADEEDLGAIGRGADESVGDGGKYGDAVEDDERPVPAQVGPARDGDQDDDADLVTDGGLDAVEHFAAYVSGVLELDASVSLSGSAAVIDASPSALRDAEAELRSRGYDAEVDESTMTLVVRPTDEDLRAVLDAIDEGIPGPGERLEVEDPVERDELATDGGRDVEDDQDEGDDAPPWDEARIRIPNNDQGVEWSQGESVTSHILYMRFKDEDAVHALAQFCAMALKGDTLAVEGLDPSDVELEDLAPAFDDEDDQDDDPELVTDGGTALVGDDPRAEWCGSCQRYRVSCCHSSSVATDGGAVDAAKGAAGDGSRMSWRERADELEEKTGLKRREAEVQALKERGLSHAEIGEKLGIAKKTVDEYSRRVNTRVSEARATLREVDVDAETDGGDLEDGAE